MIWEGEITILWGGRSLRQSWRVARVDSQIRRGV